MAAKNKHSEAIDPIIRYLNDQMSPEDRNEFERNLQRDPFEAEALEGFSTLPQKTLLQDLNSFNILKESPQIGKMARHFALIAGVIIALGLAIYLSVLFVPGLIKKIDYKKISETVSLSGMGKEKPAKALTDPVMPKFQVPAISVTDSIQGTTSPKDLGTQYIATNKEKEAPAIKEPIKRVVKKSPPKKIEPLKPMDLDQINPKQASQNQQLTFHNQETEALSEPVKSQVDRNLSQNDTESSPSGKLISGLDVEPKPIGGEKLYRSYLETNCRYPAGLGKDNKETVRLKFRVSPNGNPYQISITKSPGPEFSNEAIRLIIEGPRWSPAVKDGKPVVGEVSLRINFKP